jgi:hypothetical protein
MKRSSEQCHCPGKNNQRMAKAKENCFIEKDNPTWEDLSAAWFDGKQVLRFAQDDKFVARDEELRPALINPFQAYL